MDIEEIKRIEEKVDQILKFGHGEVIIKIINGHIHRVIKTEDELWLKK